MTKEREIRSILHDGTEVVYNTGDRVLFLAARPGGMPLTTDPESLYDDLVLTLEQRDATIKELQDEVKKQSDLKHETYRENAKWQDECNKLRKALEEAKAEYSKEGTDIQVLRRMIKIIDAALGEGEKHE